MADNTGSAPAETYKDLLKIAASNAGLDTTLRAVESGNGVVSPLQLSTEFVNIPASKLKIGGTAITPTAAEINYLSGVTSGIQAQIDAAGGAHETVETKTISASVNQVDFTTIPAGGFFEIQFWFEHALGNHPVFIINDSIATDYEFQEIQGYNNTVYAVEDLIEVVGELSGGGYEWISGSIKVKNINQTGTFMPEIDIEVSTIRGAGSGALGVHHSIVRNVGQTSITKISFGGKNWFQAANAANLITAGEFKLIKVV